MGEDAGPVRRAQVADSPPARAVPGAALVPTRAHLIARTLLRSGVTPYLVACDVAAWGVATLLAGRVHGRDLVLLVVVLLLFASGGLYRSRLSLSSLDDAPAVLGRALAAGAITTSLGLLVDAADSDAQLLGRALGLALLALSLRAVAYAAVRAVRRREWVAHPTLVLGAGQVGGQLATALLERREYGLRPVGFLDEDPLLGPGERPVPLLGGQSSLASIIIEFGVQDVIVAFGSLPESDMVDLLRTCDRLDVEIFFVPRLFELHHTSRDMDQVWGVPLVRQRKAAFRQPAWRVKRLVDVVLSAIALVLLAPVMAAIALAVRAEDSGPVLFRQERVGLDGRPFSLLKFRSLKPVDDAEAATRWTVADDDRIGPVGRVLRATSLDELPQLWNVLRGDMTLVGPRPERPHFVAEFSRGFPRYTARHRVPAGLTGWAQIHGLRGDTSIRDRVRFDNYYIANWSLWTDVKILVRTVVAVLRRTGS